jgi:hypothetical protein
LLKLLLIALLALASCRSEHTVYITDWLQAEVKKPPAGMIQLLGHSVIVRYRGRTVVEAPSLYYLSVGQATAFRDDGRRGVIMVRQDGSETDLRCDGGASLAPERFPGIDCWRGWTTEDFQIIRYAANGEVVHTYGPPAKASACGKVRIGYLGYESRGEPVAAYECIVDGTRVCRATTLEDTPQELGELRAPTTEVDCGYLVKNEGNRRYSDVRSWTELN